MKKNIIIILTYSIIVLILLAIISIPINVDQEKIEASIQHEMNSIRKISEEKWPDMPEDIREDSLKINENIIRNSYESSNTFSVRFVSNSKALFIILVIGIIIVVLHTAHRRELGR